jgi:hypothetical protein
MVRYIKCPRCELNYIDGDKQEYCDVCIAELKGNKLQFADLEDEELEEELENEQTELCPICGVNHIRFGETMCEACRQKSEYEDDEVESEDDEEWKNYLDDDTEDLTIDDEDLEEELKEDLDGDDDEGSDSKSSDDDFFDDDVDSLSDLEDDEFDDDDDDDDGDDDLF